MDCKDTLFGGFFSVFSLFFFSEDVEKLLCVLEANGLFYLKFFGVL